MGLLTPLAVRIGAISWMPRLLPQVVWTDKRLQSLTRGRVSILDVAGLPNLTLTVPGRKSGVPRSTPLLCVPHDGGWLVAGSYFGDPKMPMWVRNLRAADPTSGTVTATMGGRTVTVAARELDGEARAEAWQAMLRTWPNYALYEQRTDRTIPVFHLTPLAASNAA
ncbi:nitroreductase family deazaflavin-dependent oxidoreductase [Nocardioides marmotae]|uniref:nitroreductase family deazaflavin-dependent oxidoreductase n=1 Tax=Nocardioides marmotae TaxID=2663857 RepID=UPI0012B64612|nr:nitroreductase family deazaflavin-dependent oxidoreductase [Nocardioides marmotae]MBC9733034.1 nitroreductase family deazaflavin-dependent oxidoreductase [Nocardioides marmotae]MTB84148.1 nitroreductase family deazaflavin-dependent oxidoreductase [Nocardioides marmotae]